MSTPKRPAGEYFPARTHNVPIALSEGLGWEASRAEIVFILFLARTTKGWEARGGSLSLDWVAARLHVSASAALDRTIKTLRDAGVITTTRTQTHATYTLTDKFIRDCDYWVARRRMANYAKLHKVLTKAPPGWSLDDITEVHMDTTLEGDELLEELHRRDAQRDVVAAREHLQPVAKAVRKRR